MCVFSRHPNPHIFYYPSMNIHMGSRRRRLLVALGAGTITTLAGCTGESDGTTSSPNTSVTEDNTSVEDEESGGTTSSPNTSETEDNPSVEDEESDSSTEVPEPPTEQTAVLVADDADSDERDFFGNSVGVSNDGRTVLIGARGDRRGQGSAYVFGRSSGEWEQQAKLSADEVSGFGRRVALSGDGSTAAIGTRTDPIQTQDRTEATGSVYVFTRSDREWKQQARITPEPDVVFTGLSSLSSDGSTIVTRASQESDESVGSAYVLTRSDGEWEQQAKLSADDHGSDVTFGSSLDVSGDGSTAVIGEKDGKNITGEDTGAAYVFTQSGGSWQQQSKLLADDGNSRDKFGDAVALSDDGSTVVIGAFRDEDPSDYAGSAYVFTRSGENWGQQAKLNAVGDNSTFLGSSVGVSSDGNIAIVGEGRGARSAGVFTRGEASWTQQTRLADNDIETQSLGISGDGSSVIIGSRGAAVVFE